MNTDDVLAEIYKNYQNNPNEVGPAFLKKIAEAEAEKDYKAILVLSNEGIGHFRETGQHEESLFCCKKALEAIDILNMTDTLEFGTTLINVGTAARAAGLMVASEKYYQEAERVYLEKLESDNLLVASLYNNFSLLYQKKGNLNEAQEYLKKALEIVSKKPECRIETATTYTNLAAVATSLNNLDEATGYLDSAEKLFLIDEEADYHYYAVLVGKGQLHYIKAELNQAAECFEKALFHIDINMGKTANYYEVKSMLDSVNQMRNTREEYREKFESGLSLSKEYFYSVAYPMLEKKFPGYMDKIAVGLVGEGSECFGYDDNLSLDHDFGPSFCIWLTDEVYDEIGMELQKEYDLLPKTYKGITRVSTNEAGKRVGVFRISEFYEKLIGIPTAPVEGNQWLFIDDARLATATNGQVFMDSCGAFSKIREELKNYYPENVRLMKLSRECSLAAQTGQYNYSRMLKRGDSVTAAYALSQFIYHSMSIVYLLNKKYAPFYKWMYRGMKDLEILNNITSLLAALSENKVDDESNQVLIQRIAQLIVAEMKNQSITDIEDDYLDAHTSCIRTRINNTVIK